MIGTVGGLSRLRPVRTVGRISVSNMAVYYDHSRENPKQYLEVRVGARSRCPAETPSQELGLLGTFSTFSDPICFESVLWYAPTGPHRSPAADNNLNMIVYSKDKIQYSNTAEPVGDRPRRTWARTLDVRVEGYSASPGNGERSV